MVHLKYLTVIGGRNLRQKKSLTIG